VSFQTERRFITCAEPTHYLVPRTNDAVFHAVHLLTHKFSSDHFSQPYFYGPLHVTFITLQTCKNAWDSKFSLWRQAGGWTKRCGQSGSASSDWYSEGAQFELTSTILAEVLRSFPQSVQANSRDNIRQLNSFPLPVIEPWPFSPSPYRLSYPGSSLYKLWPLRDVMLCVVACKEPTVHVLTVQQ
jgi:hypothetical protein